MEKSSPRIEEVDLREIPFLVKEFLNTHSFLMIKIAPHHLIPFPYIVNNE